MRSFHKVALLFAVSLGLSGCAYNPYFPGRSAGDVPATINVIRLQEAVLGTVGLNSHGAPILDANPSVNSQQVLAVAKSATISQFQNFGYRVVEDNSKRPDVLAKLYVSYIPELWPLVDRNCTVIIRITDVRDQGLLDQFDIEANAFGLYGAVLGPSRDSMVSTTAQKAVQKAVAVMQMGTGTAVVTAPVSPPAAPAPAPAAVSAAAPTPAAFSPAKAAVSAPTPVALAAPAHEEAAPTPKPVVVATPAPASMPPAPTTPAPLPPTPVALVPAPAPALTTLPALRPTPVALATPVPVVPTAPPAPTAASPASDPYPPTLYLPPDER